MANLDSDAVFPPSAVSVQGRCVHRVGAGAGAGARAGCQALLVHGEHAHRQGEGRHDHLPWMRRAELPVPQQKALHYPPTLPWNKNKTIQSPRKELAWTKYFNHTLNHFL